jgi:hypothetical protein
LDCSSMVQDASRPCSPLDFRVVGFLSAVWGCQQAGEYAIKGRLIHVTQPWFVFRAHAVGYSGLISVQGVRSIAGTTVLQAAAVNSFVCP